MPKKDAVCAVAELKEALTVCQDRNLHQITGFRIVRTQADGGDEFANQKVRDLCWEKNATLSYSPAHQPSSNGIAERMVGILKSTVRRVLKQAREELNLPVGSILLNQMDYIIEVLMKFEPSLQLKTRATPGNQEFFATRHVTSNPTEAEFAEYMKSLQVLVQDEIIEADKVEKKNAAIVVAEVINKSCDIEVSSDNAASLQCPYDPEWIRNRMENSPHQCQSTLVASDGEKGNQIYLSIYF